jgi:hypothetical protein
MRAPVFAGFVALLSIGCASAGARPPGEPSSPPEDPPPAEDGAAAEDAAAVVRWDARPATADAAVIPEPPDAATAPRDVAVAADAPPPADAAPVAAGQGPIATGRIVYSQDFEMGSDGITRSPTDLPPDRAQVADDPLGQRGKVMKISWLAGDDFMTHGGSTHTRSFISNTGYSFPLGTTIEYAWGFMTGQTQIDAAFAQVIRSGGPMWLIEGNGDGSTYVNCRSCGGKADLPVKLVPNRWYDLRVQMTYANGGPVRFFIDGVMVLERKMSVSDAPGTRAHWDGGLYNHAAGTTTRIVYISNLSVATQ